MSPELELRVHEEVNWFFLAGGPSKVPLRPIVLRLVERGRATAQAEVDRLLNLCEQQRQEIALLRGGRHE
jgi:hypothetical protein